MTQSLIIDKLANFVEYIAELEAQEMRRDAEAIRLSSDAQRDEKAKALFKAAEKRIENAKVLAHEIRTEPGYCYGFSLIHGAMDSIEKGDWWEAALKCVANWDKGNLDQAINLPGQSDNLNVVTRKDICERVLNYMISSQVPDSKFQKPFQISSQFNLLDPVSKDKDSNTGNFQIMRGDEILTVRSRDVIGGFFDEQDIANILDENTVKNTILLVESPIHALRIGFKEGEWVLYDPNYEHNKDKADTIYKKFKTKQELAREIFQQLGNVHSLIFDMVSLSNNYQAKFPPIDASALSKRLNGDGLIAIASVIEIKPEFADFLFDSISKNKNVRNAFIEALPKTLYEFTGLKTLIAYLDDQRFDSFIKLANQDKKLRDGIARAFFSDYRPEYVNLADNNFSNYTDVKKQEFIKLAVGYLVESKRTDDQDFQLLANTAEHDTVVRDAMAEALKKRTADNKNTLRELISKSPTSMYPLFSSLLQDPKNISVVLQALAELDDQNKTGWNVILKTTKNEKKDILHLLTSAASKLDPEEANNLMKVIEAGKSDKNSPYRGLFKKWNILGGVYGKTLIASQVIKTLKQKAVLIQSTGKVKTEGLSEGYNPHVENVGLFHHDKAGPKSFGTKILNFIKKQNIK